MTEEIIIKSKTKQQITDEWLSGIDVKEERYYSIGEVSTLCNNVKPHVLRYWESQFKNLSPVRRKERRYYRHGDVVTIRNIYNLVHFNRYTVEGAKKHFANIDSCKTPVNFDKTKANMLNMIKDLEKIDRTLLVD
mgnify:CR=1 FL=1